MSEGQPHSGWTRTQRGRKTALVATRFHPTITEALLEQTGCRTAERSGRGTLLQCDTREGRVLIRPYRRGGFLRHFIRDTYLFANRPLRELDAHRYAYDRGVPVPAPVGAMWEQHGALFRGAIASLEVPAEDLLAFLTKHRDPPEEALRACGRAIRALHSAGIVHGDLQVKNLLVTEDAAWVLDFDKARRAGRLNQAEAMSNLDRLRRSFLKRELDLRHFECIVEGYYEEG